MSAPYGYEAVPRINVPKAGLVGLWYGGVLRNKVPDESGNGNDGSVASPGLASRSSLYGRVLGFGATADNGWLDCGNPSEFNFGSSTDFTLIQMFRAHNTTSNGGSGKKTNAADTNSGYALHLSGVGVVTSYVCDGVSQVIESVTGDRRDGLWHLAGLFADRDGNLVTRVDLDSSSGSSISGIGDIDNSLKFGIGSWRGDSLGSGYQHGEIAMVALYNRVVTEDEFKAIYADMARAVQFKTAWGISETVSNQSASDRIGQSFGMSPFEILSGTWKVVSEEIEGKLCKVIECVTAGAAVAPVSLFKASPREAAYGTWDFWVSKADASALELCFIADDKAARSGSSQDGYCLRFRTDESIYLQEVNSGVLTSLWGSNASAYSHGTWYNIRMTREALGKFTGYIRAEDADFALLSAAAVGTNPITDNTTIVSNYVVLDFDAGDKMAYSDMMGNHCFQKGVGAVVP